MGEDHIGTDAEKISNENPLQFKRAYFKPKSESDVDSSLNTLNTMAKAIDDTTEAAHGHVVEKLKKAVIPGFEDINMLDYVD